MVVTLRTSSRERRGRNSSTARTHPSATTRPSTTPRPPTCSTRVNYPESGTFDLQDAVVGSLVSN
ncbi:hypothetical protein HSB1_31910 [Halogranum salarium B-1]|uniref:Uncharacterized protein n=1 Tax=Halogranum salarium B-1 TaxID=1210908 RepID=J3A082_9EURY|nr:hypothetical protein HSB1_31910 [Halogranum salarium B-1]